MNDNISFMTKYEAKTFSIGELEGISKDQINQHLGLYSGYVKNVNGLQDDLAMYMEDSQKHARALSELMRRFGFEFNGMRLHEYYFEQLGESGVSSASGESGELKAAIVEQFGSFEAWENQFKAIGKMRGIGWVLLVRDELHGNLHNIWVSDHELGHLGGQDILCAMDVWEHAYMVDHGAKGRGDYIDAFFANLNWGVCEARFCL
jgi:superoxide dismutase, Fe-Mn family